MGRVVTFYCTSHNAFYKETSPFEGEVDITSPEVEVFTVTHRSRRGCRSPIFFKANATEEDLMKLVTQVA